MRIFGGVLADEMGLTGLYTYDLLVSKVLGLLLAYPACPEDIENLKEMSALTQAESEDGEFDEHSNDDMEQEKERTTKNGKTVKNTKNALIELGYSEEEHNVEAKSRTRGKKGRKVIEEKKELQSELGTLIS